MSVLFVTTIVIFAIAILAFLGGLLFARDSKAPKIVGISLIVLAVIIGLFASLTTVPARSVGVVTAFGKPLKNLGPGIHWKKPWHRVYDMDGAIVTDENLGDQRTEIRMGNQANAYVQNVVRWKINTEQAEGLYADYRKDENIGPSLVEPELAAALNYAFADYDPLATTASQSYDQVADQVKARLNQRIGDRCADPELDQDPKTPIPPAKTTVESPCFKIIVESVIIPKVDFDKDTQDRINAVQQENANSRIAAQRKTTAESEADANRTLSGSVSNDPNVLVSKCIDMISRGVPVPPGFQCWPQTGGNTIVGR